MIANKHSKNLTRISFAVLFTITLSLAFHAPLPEASAAAGDITAVKTQSEGNNLEHDLDLGAHASLVQVDSDTYALAYTGTGTDGFISTFTISSDGTTITEVASLEHDTDNASHNSLVQVDSDTYALAYEGADSDGFISTFTIDSDGNITAVMTQSEGNNLEHETDIARYNSLVQVDSDTYALAYEGPDSDGFISTFTISSDGTTITEVASLEHDTNIPGANYNSLVQVDSDTIALAYTGWGADGFISTFTIDSDGTITAVKTQSEGNNLEHETGSSVYNSLVQVDSDTYALAYSGGAGASNDGYISTFDIATSTPHKVGTVSTTSSGQLSWTAPTAGGSEITDYIIQYSTDDSTWSTFDDGTSTDTTATVTCLTNDTTYYFRVAAVNSSGTGDFSSSSSVLLTLVTCTTDSTSTGGGGHGNCDSRAFGLNKSLKVNQVSYDIETFELAVQAYSACGPITSKVFTSTQLGTLGLSMNQPLLDENIVIYSTYLEESDKKFRILLENDRNSFDETFYIYDKSIIKTYKGFSHYTSEQQGTTYQQSEPILELAPEPEPTLELAPEPEPTPEPTQEPTPEPTPETDTSMWYWFVIPGLLGMIFLLLYKRMHKNAKNVVSN